MNAPLVKELNTAFRSLVREVNVEEIVPLGFLAMLDKPAPDPGGVVAFDVKPTLSTALDEEDEGAFFVRGDFILSVREDTGADKQEEAFLQLRYTVLGRYVVPEGFAHPLDEPLLKQFAETNAIVHLWPYLRAYVSSACGQLGLPALTIPVLRQKKATAPKSE